MKFKAKPTASPSPASPSPASPSPSPASPSPSPASPSKRAPVRGLIRVHKDAEYRTCIELGRDGAGVVYIPLSKDGFKVERAPSQEFDARFSPIEGYPIERAAMLYAKYARHLGGTQEAMGELAKLTTIPEADYKQALKAIDLPITERGYVSPKGPKAPRKNAKPQYGKLVRD